MKEFMNDDFMLTNDTAKILYKNYAEKMPIFDYHCHLSPLMIYEDKPFDNIAQIFWVVIIINGVICVRAA